MICYAMLFYTMLYYDNDNDLLCHDMIWYDMIWYDMIWYRLDSKRTVIGQFIGPYSTVRPAKFKTLFLRALFQDKEI